MIVGYLTGTYPRASDTFIQREVDGVRAAGLEVRTYSVRRPGAEHLVGPEQQREHSTTTYLVPASAKDLLAAQRAAARLGRWRPSAQLAADLRPGGGRGSVYQGIYFAEAALLARHLVADGVQHLHNHFGDQSGTVAMLAARIAGIPFSMTIHGPHIFFEPHRWALGDKVGASAFTSCISHFCRSQVMVFAPETSWDRLPIIHCGVRPAIFDEPRQPGAERFRVMTVSRLAAEKGLPVLFGALAAVRDQLSGLELTIVGDGPDRVRLEKQAAALGLAAEFRGSLGQSEVREALRDADVLASPGFAEGLPTALMEAMAARVPVVATRIAGVPELVEDGVTGRLVVPGDQADLARAFVQLHGLGWAGRRAWGEAGRARVVRDFDSDVEAAKLATLFVDPGHTVR